MLRIRMKTVFFWPRLGALQCCPALPAKMSYYAVSKGRNPGIYSNWNDCKNQVDKYSGAVYKKFSSAAEAQAFVSQGSYSRSSSSSSSSGGCDGGSSYSGGNGGGSSYSSHYSEILQPYSSRNSSISSYSSKSAREYSSNSSNSHFQRDSEGRVDIYTDGACTDNGTSHAKAGIGVYFNDDHPENVSRRANGRVTNNSAEIEAVIEAANVARRNNIDKIRIITDSEFLINCITKWMNKWKTHGWKTANNKPVINKEELMEMERALAPLDVQFTHVRGHNGVHGNEMADRLARMGAHH